MDASTPRAALRTLNIAMRDGDVATITHLFLAATPSEEKMVEADRADGRARPICAGRRWRRSAPTEQRS